MIKVTLQFTSLLDLWKFKSNATKSQLTVMEKLNVLIGEFSETEVQNACTEFRAHVIRKQELQPALLER